MYSIHVSWVRSTDALITVCSVPNHTINNCHDGTAHEASCSPPCVHIAMNHQRLCLHLNHVCMCRIVALKSVLVLFMTVFFMQCT